jgi:hypothetical protein
LPETDYQDQLRTAAVSLFDTFGPGYFDLSCTCNVLLRGDIDGRFSLFYGQSYSKFSYLLGEPQVIRNPGDVASIRTDFDISDFEEVFFSNFSNSLVTVDSIVSTIFIFSRYLDNFERDRATEGDGPYGLLKLY